MSLWQPQQEPLRQLAQYLKDSLSGHDQSAQKNAELVRYGMLLVIFFLNAPLTLLQMLKNAKTSPDINNYLTYLVSNPEKPASLTLTVDGYHAARSAAAIMLKNDIKTSYRSIPTESKAYIRSLILQGLADLSPQIRNYAGNVITETVRQGGIMEWPQIFSSLTSLISNDPGSISTHTQEGAMNALFKICEDSRRALDKEYQGQRPLDFILPKLLEFTTSPLAKIRSQSMATINIFIPDKPQSVMAILDSFLMQLFNLTSDANEMVRKQVCRSIIHVADIAPDRIIPHMSGLVDFIVAQQRNDKDPDLALDAAEFWLCVGEDSNLQNSLGPHLPRIIPVLLESMIYGEDDVLRLESMHEDAAIEDREEDIKPAFASFKMSRAVSVPANGTDSTSNANANTKININGKQQLDNAAKHSDELSDGELEESDDDDEDIGDPEEQWNLRKCSAAALDVLASVFHQPVFEVTLPYLKENLSHSEWPNREAAVLALGAIADGCMEVVQPHLPDLTQYLVTLLQDKQPVVRIITCWTLGRYSSWASHLDTAGKKQFFEPVMDGLLQRMLDTNKRVQEAAASAFANLEDKAKVELKDYCPIIIRQFVKCFALYKDRNMFILYDCIQTLAEHVGSTLANPELVSLLMPALIQRWTKVTDQSRELFPLLECLSYVATALGDSFSSFAKPIFTRCVNIVSQNIEESWRAAAAPELIESPEKDFLVTSLDLTSAIIQALDPDKGAELVSTSEPNIFHLLAFCMKDTNNDVRQSAYALLGDAAIYVFPQLQPYLPSLMDILLEQLDVEQIVRDGEETGYSVINNACWSLGEIAMRQLEGMAPYVDRLLTKLFSILFNSNVPESLTENAAIALSRLGIGNAPLLAPHLSSFAAPVLKALGMVEWSDEKGHALKGFVNIVLCNPKAMEPCLILLFMEIANAPRDILEKLKGDGPSTLFAQVCIAYIFIIGP